MRVLRSSLLDVDQEDYIQQARLRGLSEGRILLRHALKNAILPTLTLMGVQFGFLFGGTLLIEVIYSYPGLGNLMVDAVRNADLPIIQARRRSPMRRRARHQHGGRRALPHAQSEAEGRVMPIAAPHALPLPRSLRVAVGFAIVGRSCLSARCSRRLLAPHDPQGAEPASHSPAAGLGAGGDAAFPLGTDLLGR